MGPLVPDIVTNELNLIVALLVGIAFGYVLEQAGFSSSRKLTGLFYGTDFTVLRVFFTAGVTAMIGVLLLIKLGFLDGSVIYVNPTFLHSAIAGGLIMGVGFVVGGFCPGTSFCAAAVGRIDAMAFVAGGLAGVLVFGEAFPAVQPLYQAGSRGDVTVPAVLGVAPGTFALIMALVATAAFVVVGRVERRVTRAARSPVPWRHALAAIGWIAVALVAALLPDSRARLLAMASDPGQQRTYPVDRMTADELAFRIVDRDPTLLIIDVRTAERFTHDGLPGALNLTVADLFGRIAPPALSRSHRRGVFVADSEREALAAATLARLLGFDNVAVLAGGLGGFKATILDAASAPAAVENDADIRAFRVDAARQITALARARAPRAIEAKPKKIVGGCGV
jgi:uncharacterized protein